MIFTMDATTRDQLVRQSLSARQNAYCPYSSFQVGSAVMAADGSIFTGANVENASFGLTICAERAAASAAVSAGHRQLAAVAVASPGGQSPCGACRQFLAEFGPSMIVLLVDAGEPARIDATTLDALLPSQFHPGALPQQDG